DVDALWGKRLGVMRHTFGQDAQLDVHMELQLAALREAGAILVDVDMPLPAGLAAAEMRILLHEFKEGINSSLQARGGEIQSLAELIQFNRSHAAEEMTDFGQELFELAQQ